MTAKDLVTALLQLAPETEIYCASYPNNYSDAPIRRIQKETDDRDNNREYWVVISEY